MEQITGRVDDNVRLLTDVDPRAPRGAGVPDPWYGDEDGFGDTMASVEGALPGLLAHLRSTAPAR